MGDTIWLLLGFFGMIAGSIVLIIVLTAGYIACAMLAELALELPFAARNHSIRKRLSELKEEGFSATHQYIKRGQGVAIDGAAKQVFLADRRVMKLYDVEDVLKAEHSKTEMTQNLTVTVRDIQSPVYEFVCYFLGTKKFREITSLFAVIMEPVKQTPRPLPTGSRKKSAKPD